MYIHELSPAAASTADRNIVILDLASDKTPARNITYRILINSDGWKEIPKIENDSFEPLIILPVTSTAPKSTTPRIPRIHLPLISRCKYFISDGIISAMIIDTATIANCLTDLLKDNLVRITKLTDNNSPI